MRGLFRLRHLNSPFFMTSSGKIQSEREFRKQEGFQPHRFGATNHRSMSEWSLSHRRLVKPRLTMVWSVVLIPIRN